MSYKRVRDRDLQKRRTQLRFRIPCCDMFSEPAAVHILFHSDDQRIPACCLPKEFRIQRHYKPRIGYGALQSPLFEAIPDLKRCFDHISDSKEQNSLLLKEHLRFAELNGRIKFRESVVCSSARIAHRRRLSELYGELKHVSQFLTVLGRHDCHPRHCRKVRQIKNPLVRLSVGTDNSCTIDRKHHRKLLKTYVLDDLIIGPLQKSGVDSEYRFQASCSQAGSE